MNILINVANTAACHEMRDFKNPGTPVHDVRDVKISLKTIPCGLLVEKANV